MKKIIDLGKIGITLAGEYNDKATYEKLTIVLYKGKSYISTKTVQGLSPEQDIHNWQLVAEAKDAYNMLVDAGKTTLTEEEFLKQLEDATKGRYIVQGNVINAADEEDLTIEHSDLLGIDTLKLANRDNTNGMGYVILRKNKSFAEQVTKENTIYEIRYDFDLNGQEIIIPNNCILKFEGGKIFNGKLIFNSTYIYTNIISSILPTECNGTIFNKILYPEWFYEGNGDYTKAIQTCINLGVNKTIELTGERYLVSPLKSYKNHFYCLEFNTSNISFISKCNSVIYTNTDINYRSIIYDKGTYTNNITIDGITFDQSGDVDTIIPSGETIGLNVILFYAAANVTIQNCVLQNACGVNPISVNGSTCINTLIANNKIIYSVNTSAGNYDRSAIYINDINHTIINNVIDVLNPEKDFIRGGIESHGKIGKVCGNVIKYCNVAINIVSNTLQEINPVRVFSNNLVDNCNTFIMFWPTQDFTPISNIIISNNSCTNIRTAISVHIADNTYGDIENVSVKNNIFKGNFVAFTEEQRNWPEYCVFLFNGYSNIKNFVIESNIISDFPSTLLSGLPYNTKNTFTKEIFFKNNICTNLLNNTQPKSTESNLVMRMLFFVGANDNTLVENNTIEVSSIYNNVYILVGGLYGNGIFTFKKNKIIGFECYYNKFHNNVKFINDINIYYLNKESILDYIIKENKYPKNVGDIFINSNYQLETVTSTGRKNKTIEGLDTTNISVSVLKPIMKLTVTSIGDIKIGDQIHLRFSNYNETDKELSLYCIGINGNTLYLWNTSVKENLTTTPTLVFMQYWIYKTKIILNVPTKTPDSPIKGSMIFSDNGKPIWWNGAAWIDATGTNV